LYPHQEDAVKELSNGKVLWGGVGSGKSRTALAYYMRKEAPRNLYIITTAKKRDSLDWEGEAAAFGIGKKKDATVAGILKVDSWNNIGKYVDVENAWFVFDEQRLVGSGAWVKSFLKIVKNNRWVLLSATPGDTWLDYIPVFLANGFYKNRTEFLREHVVYSSWSKYPKVERYLGEAKLRRLRNQVLVHMPYKSHMDFVEELVTVPHDEDLYRKVLRHRWNPFKEEPIKNVSDLFYNLRKVLNSDPSRLSETKKLLETHDRIIIFYNFDYELDILRELQKEVAVGEWNGHKHEPIPDTDRWVYLVQYASGSESWNCVETNVILFYSLTYSYKMFKQAKGRIDRLNSPFETGFFYVFFSKGGLDLAIWKALRTKRDFNVSLFKI
jgi:hypothetical protein